jgi:hypothetical protein
VVSAEIVVVGPPLEDPLLEPPLPPLLPLPLPLVPPLPLPLDEALPAPPPLLPPPLDPDPPPEEDPLSPGWVTSDESLPGEALDEQATAKPEARTSAPRREYEKESERMVDLFRHRSYKSCASATRTAATTEFHTFSSGAYIRTVGQLAPAGSRWRLVTDPPDASTRRTWDGDTAHEHGAHFTSLAGWSFMRVDADSANRSPHSSFLSSSRRAHSRRMQQAESRR